MGGLSSVTKDNFEGNLGLCLNKPTGQIILSKERLRFLLKKYLRIILEKGQNGIYVGEQNYTYNSKWSQKQDIDYFEQLIDKFLDQEVGELIGNGELVEKGLISANPFGYSEWQDLRFLIYTIFQNMKVSDFAELGDNNEIKQLTLEEIRTLKSIIPSIKRILTRRQTNRKTDDILNGRIEGYEQLVENMPKFFWGYATGGINIKEEWREDKNTTFVGPKEEGDISFDIIFSKLFSEGFNTIPQEKRDYYKEITDHNDKPLDILKIYDKIIGYSSENISDVELIAFIECIENIYFSGSFELSKQSEAFELASIEEIERIFTTFKNGSSYGLLYKCFLSYILPKIYKIKIANTIRTNNQKNRPNELNSYLLESKPDVTSIAKGIDIYTMGQSINIKNYLVVKGRIIKEFDWFKKDDYLQTLRSLQEDGSKSIMSLWDTVIRIGNGSKNAYMYASDGELVGGEFDEVGEIEEGVDGDKVFWARRGNKKMYINVRTGKPIGGEFDEVGEIEEGLFGDKYFETYLEIVNHEGKDKKFSDEGIKISLRYGKEVAGFINIRLQEIRRRLKTVDGATILYHLKNGIIGD